MLIFDNIKVEFDVAQLTSRMCLTSDMPEYLEFEKLLAAIKPHAVPVALLDEALILGKTSGKIVSSLGEFDCPLLLELAGESKSLFPFIVTCGKSMDDFGTDISDPLHLYWVDFLKEYALEEAFEKIKSEVAQKCPNQRITSLVPLNEEVWKLDGLKEVFNVFPDEAVKRIGVELTESLFMKPNKSRAGVFFPADKDVDFCTLCSIKKCKTCPVRRRRQK